jgi:hypothetical protein
VLAITLLSGHVAPSVDDNNRYLKLTPLGDRVRLAYTVFYGEVPGASVRPAIDTNKDGTIDKAEAQAFGDQVARQVADGLDVDVDGHPERVTWAVVDVGLGSPQVAAGSFSVDLVAYLCLPVARGHHRVTVHDRFRIPHPGETEVKIEDSPGVTIEHAHVGPADDPSYDYRFAGPGGPMSDDGLDLAFTAGPKAPVAPDATCAGTPPSTSAVWHWWIVLAGVPVLVLAAWLLSRRRAQV